MKITEKPTVVFGHTPLCGTCRIAEYMLDIAVKSLELDVIKINLNLHEDFVKKYEISSSPAFLLFKDGKLYDQFYAFHDVKYIYEKLGTILTK